MKIREAPPKQGEPAARDRLLLPPEPRWARYRGPVGAILLTLLLTAVLLIPVLGGKYVVAQRDEARFRETATADMRAALARQAELNATATAQAGLLAMQQATAQAVSTVAAMPTVTPPPAPTSTPAPATATPAASPTKATGVAPGLIGTPTPYVANFAAWPTATPTVDTPARVSYDPGTKEYIIAITDPHWDQVYIQYVPERTPFGDFTLDVDIRQVAGPPNTNVGVVFGAQPKGPQDKVNAGYNFLVIPGQQRVGVTYTGANEQRTLLGAQPAPMFKKDSANHLRLSRKGGRIVIGVNGQQVAEYPAAVTAPGAIGLIVSNPKNNPGPAGAAAAFSNLQVAPFSSEGR